MISFSLPAFIKFLVGVLLLQGATVLLVMMAQDVNLQKNGWLIVALGILIGVIAALWFSAITSHANQHSFARASEKFNRQRDYLRRKANKEQTREIKKSHEQLLRETRRVQNRSSVKVGVAMAGIAGLGILLLFTQFMTLGLLAVSATGGALLGYGVRARQYPAMAIDTDDRTGWLSGKTLAKFPRLAGGKRTQPADTLTDDADK